MLVSEFPLRAPPRRHHFYRRNRTLSGLSGSTLAVEAGRPSGTLLTASAAADQGGTVLVLPWSIYHAGGTGCRYLLRDGAELVQSVEDLFACPRVPRNLPSLTGTGHWPHAWRLR
jgi:DNA processing protein